MHTLYSLSAIHPELAPFALGFMTAFIPVMIIIAVWTIIVKGFALWHAARGGQKKWFIALLIVNTLGILEVIYLVWFRPGRRSSADA